MQLPAVLNVRNAALDHLQSGVLLTWLSQWTRGAAIGGLTTGQAWTEKLVVVRVSQIPHPSIGADAGWCKEHGSPHFMVDPVYYVTPSLP